MKRFLTVALVATLVLAVVPAAASQREFRDVIIEESSPLFPLEGELQSRSSGATMGPGGVHYFALRVEYPMNTPATDAQGYVTLLRAYLNQPFEVSGMKARFVVEGPFPWSGSAPSNPSEAYNSYAESRPADGKFGMLLVPHLDGGIGGVAGVPDVVRASTRLRSVVSLEGWVFAGRPTPDTSSDTSMVKVPGHELGHNLGLLHDECPTPSNNSGCGYVNSKQTGSLMSVDGQVWMLRFSDRTAVVEGELFGDVNASAVQFVNERLPMYAAHAAPVVVPCTVPDPLKLHDERFDVHVCYDVSDTVTGFGKPQTDTVTPRAANFWFFNPDNTELVLKIQNACAEPFNHYWFFAAGLTNVGVTITVVDTDSGLQRTYRNPRGSAFEPIQDTEAFDTCP